MPVRTLNCTLATFAAIVSLSTVRLPAEETPEPTQQQSGQQSGTAWQAFVPQPQQQGVTFQPTFTQPTWQSGVTWQGFQPIQSVPLSWNVSTLTYSNPLGVEVAPADAALRSQLGLDEQKKGVVVTNVRQDSEAEKSGLKVHDLILKFGDADVETPEALNEAVSGKQGHDAKLEILRQGKPVTLPIAVPQAVWFDLAMNNGTTSRIDLNHVLSGQRYRIGVVLAEADDTLRSQLRLEAGEGLVVTKVLPETPASEAEIHEHDILIKLDGKRPESVEALNKQVQEIQDRKVAVLLLRGGKEVRLELAPQLEEGAAARVHFEPLQLNAFNRMANPMRSPIFTNNVGFEHTQQQQQQQEVATQANAADQLATLQKQVAVIQQTLQRLEASLRSGEKDEPDEEAQSQEEE